jgi:hypothetical protein
MREKASNLSGAELDALAGVKGSPPPSPPTGATSTVLQAAQTISTVLDGSAVAVIYIATVAQGVIVAT